MWIWSGEIVDQPFKAAARQDRQPDLVIGGQGDAEAPLRARKAHLVAACFQLAAQHLQCPHHAVDLGRPGVGHDEDFQGTDLCLEARLRRRGNFELIYATQGPGFNRFPENTRAPKRVLGRLFCTAK